MSLHSHQEVEGPLIAINRQDVVDVGVGIRLVVYVTCEAESRRRLRNLSFTAHELQRVDVTLDILWHILQNAQQ